MKLPQLTFTRFIAAMAIVIFHFSRNVFPFEFSEINLFVSYFNVLVSYFFVLSGFILTINSSEKLNIRKFYLNRFSRIYPLYFLAFLLSLFLILNARTPAETISFNKIVLSIFLIQSWSSKYWSVFNYPAWSLSVEAFFYLLFPFLYLVLQKCQLKKQLIYIISYWVFIQFLYIYLIKNSGHGIYTNPFFYLSGFLIGVGSGFLFKKRYNFLVRHTSKIEIISIVTFIVLGFLIFSEYHFFRKIIQRGILAPAFVTLIYSIALSKHKIIQIFANRQLQYLGEISYGIYILQVPVHILIFGILNRIAKVSNTTGFYIYLAALLIISALAYELIEKPCKKFIRNKFG